MGGLFSAINSKINSKFVSFFNNKNEKISGRFVCKSFCIFSFYPVFYSQWTLNVFSICAAAYWTSFWIASYEMFLIYMMILILIMSYILIFYTNFELIFEFMALKRAPICGRNVCLSFFLRIFTSNSEKL